MSASLPQSTPALARSVAAVAGPVGSIVRLPAQILLTGLSILLLAWIATLFRVPALSDFATAISGKNVLETIIALLVFLVGLSFAGFLWWVVGRYFSLVSSGSMNKDGLEALKGLPLGLPEGTVRSVLALIVAVVGLPLIVFAEVMHLGPQVSGYLNGIITGVFGFYFGARSKGSSNKGIDAQTIDQISDAKSRATQAEDARDDAKSQADIARAHAQASQQQAAQATRSAGFDNAVGKLNRELGVASEVLKVIAPALPTGILPASLATAVSTASDALNAVRGVTQDRVTDAQHSTLQDALGTLMGNGSSKSLGALISTAAPMLSGLAIPGVGSVTALVALLSVGMKLGSQEYARWRARVLAAPLAHGLVEFGTVTPDDVEAALLDAPLFAKAFAEERDRPGFDAQLADAVLRDDALERLWQRYGTGHEGQPPLFADRAELEQALAEFLQALLASRAAGDLPDALPAAVTESLAQAKDPAIRAAGTTPLDRDALNRIVDAAAKASMPAATAPTNAHAAFDALVTLVGQSRLKGIDLLGALSEVAP